MCLSYLCRFLVCGSHLEESPQRLQRLIHHLRLIIIKKNTHILCWEIILPDVLFNFVDTFYPQIHESVPFSHKKKKVYIYTHKATPSQLCVCRDRGTTEDASTIKGAVQSERKYLWPSVTHSPYFSARSVMGHRDRDPFPRHRRRNTCIGIQRSLSLPELAPLLRSSPCCFLNYAMVKWEQR